MVNGLIDGIILHPICPNSQLLKLNKSRIISRGKKTDANRSATAREIMNVLLLFLWCLTTLK